MVGGFRGWMARRVYAAAFANYGAQRGMRVGEVIGHPEVLLAARRFARGELAVQVVPYDLTIDDVGDIQYDHIARLGGVSDLALLTTMLEAGREYDAVFECEVERTQSLLTSTRPWLAEVSVDDKAWMQFRWCHARAQVNPTLNKLLKLPGGAAKAASWTERMRRVVADRWDVPVEATTREGESAPILRHDDPGLHFQEWLGVTVGTRTERIGRFDAPPNSGSPGASCTGVGPSGPSV